MDKISQAQEKFSHFDLIPLGLCILQSDYIVLYWNSCLEEWTQISRCDILGIPITRIFPHLEQPQYTTRLQQVFQGGLPTIFSSQLHQYIIPAPLPQGKNRIQHTTVTSLPGLDGDGYYALMSMQDVTDLTFRVQEYRTMRDRALAETAQRKIAQESAEAANRVKDEFLAILSHELRTPLNPILGWSKLLKTQKLDQTQTLQAIDTIERNAKLQVQLIDDLLDVSRILRGKLNLNLTAVDLAHIVQSSLQTIHLSAEVKSIDIQLTLAPNLNKVLGDTNRLQQVICNLLTNAVKFTQAGGKIEIHLEQVDLQIQLRVTDTGKGITPEFLPHIFEYFRQADSSTTRHSGGLGLGLAISRHLIELHGGTIIADSEGLGKGATFTINLPVMLVLSPESQTQLNNDDFLSLTGIRVLAVDDDPDNLEFISFLLKQAGADVTQVTSAKAALETIPLNIPHVLVSDIGMPDMDGYELIHEVQLQGYPIYAIALTAYGTDADSERIKAAGFSYHLVKPIAPDELIEAVASGGKRKREEGVGSRE
jgi:signal transduction histidine kinase/ActR/RegA family two-component response regulator